jgi:hypothetical protein
VSVRELICFASERPAAEIAALIATTLGVQAQDHGDRSEVVVPTASLVPDRPGEFGGPVVQAEPEWRHRPPGEWEASDAYEIEFRLWQASGPRVDRATGADIELAAASALFDRLASLRMPMLHVHRDEVLIAAYHPEHGLRRFPENTSVYDWDAPTWGRWVLPSPALVNPAREPDASDRGSEAGPDET